MNAQQKKRFAEALVRVSGDCDLLVAMASMVSEDAPGVWAEVQENVQQKQWQSIANSAHKLKGMLATFDTGPPIPELQEMIMAARKERSSDVMACFTNCKPEIERLLKEICDLGAVSTQ